MIVLIYGFIAQSVEQRTENPRVAGSIPAGATIYKCARLFRVLKYRGLFTGFFILMKKDFASCFKFNCSVIIL